jgi:Fe2+ transport system protein B
MVNASGSSNQLTSDQEKGKSPECPPDNKLPENSQENLDARLDHAIEETFPTSDPVSVTITKGPEPDRSDQEARASSADDQQDRSEQGSTKEVLDQVREALSDVVDHASGAARDVYNRGEHYARQAREQYPEAERYIREGQRAVTQRVAGNPLLALLMAGVAGYALAWLIHGGRQERKVDVPDYGRTDRGYAPHRDK